MATAVTLPEEGIPIPNADQPVNNGLVLIWLDDTAEEDPTVKGVLTSLFDNVLTFSDPEACLELVQSIENKEPCLSILISGKYGQMLVREHLQPLNQVKDIYVFCYDTVKHSRWAQTCDKVRCVFSDIHKIIQCMQYDIQSQMEQQPVDDEQQQQQEQQQPLHQEQPQVEPKQQHRERYTDDNNLFDQLAFNLLLQSPEDGAEDFTDYCRTRQENSNLNHDAMDAGDGEGADPAEVQEQYFKPEQAIQEWYQPDLFFTHINSNNLTKLWTLRWFIRIFHRQLTTEHEKFIQDKTKFIVHYGTRLSADELDGMKHRIGQIVIITELLMTYANRQTALDSIQHDEKNKHKVIFEINIDPTMTATVPYAEIRKDEVLVWFGARYRVVKIEYIVEEDDQENAYWIIGLNLRPTLDSKPSRQALYDYYLKELTDLNNLHHAFGRIFMYKGFYSQAEKWLQIGHHYIELVELAIRQSHYEQAKEYLEHLSADSDDANLLRAYLNILTSNDNFSKARMILMKIFSESTDKLIRARANITLGFINLIITQQIDQALEHFTLGNDVLRKLLPEIHPFLAKSFLGIGYTYYTLRKLTEAKEAFEMAFRIQRQSLIYNHPDFAKTRNGRAHCLSTDKHTIKKALNESDYALNILLDTFPNEHQRHPEIAATINDIERLKKGKELRPRNTLLDYI
jgi:tetratricopeptide (TPR) repeat protein